MMTSQQGRELMAEVLRAVANVLSKPREGTEGTAGGAAVDVSAGTDRSGNRTPTPADRATAGRSGASATDAGIDAQLPLTARDDQAHPRSGTLEGGQGTKTADEGKAEGAGRGDVGHGETGNVQTRPADVEPEEISREFNSPETEMDEP
ncbi:hypothetical protein [Microvirga massiliensis]|uniref:hypothetical protein n=1 Tax=Microvirga massiliensis TaxID=1033741 RepID=UPI0011CC9BAD|nr:hypothetical protein [Microvirga massiliensis]